MINPIINNKRKTLPTILKMKKTNPIFIEEIWSGPKGAGIGILWWSKDRQGNERMYGFGYKIWIGKGKNEANPI